MRNTDAPTKLASAIAVFAMTASALVAPSLASAAETTNDERPPQQLNAGDWIDTENRQAVIDAYNTMAFAPIPDMGWTGNHATCDTGTINPAYRTATIDRVNWYRSMAGLPAVAENVEYSESAQAATLIQAFSESLSHEPPSTATCYSEAGAEAAANSNLSGGNSGPAAIDAYVIDFGASNAKVDHRNWILSPTAQQFGTGDSPREGTARTTNVLQVIEPTSVVFADNPTLRGTEGFVAWPNSGYTPAATVYERWSFSLRGASFANANVTTQHWINGSWVTIPSSTVHRDDKPATAPFGAIVWEPVLGFPTENNLNRKLPIPKPAFDETYRVTVTDVLTNGVAQNFTYDVTVIGDQEAPRPPMAPVADVVDSPDEAFTNAAFIDFLGRDATPAEKQEWAGRIASGTDRGVLVRERTRSEEWAGSVVDRMYQETLNRAGDPRGRAHWIGQLQSDMTVAELAAHFYASDEYLRQEGGLTNLWIDDLYSELLGRQPDSAGHAFWMQQTVDLGTVPVARQIYQSEESRRARVQALYQDLLGRDPDAAGETFWSEQLVDVNDLDLAANLAASDEYHENAGK